MSLQLQSYTFLLPALAEQARIAQCLRDAERSTHTILAKQAALQAQKKGLMQRLLTGEVRVRV